MKKDLLENLITIRRQLHQHPEIGYQEFKTAKLISQTLGEWEITHKTEIARTGIVATIKKGSGPCVVLRADMDALPLQEETDLPFSSTISNVMHACGHDVHTTMLLGAAHQLKDEDFNGTIRFIFQPSEEGTNGDPDKKSGGERIAGSGLLDDAKAAIGLHVNPLLEVGKISFATGQAMAGNCSFEILIVGKYGHAAFPHLGIDAIVVATHLIQSVQTIVSRYTSPTEPVVISFTQIHGGVAPNVTAEKVSLTGTIRALDQETLEQVIERLHRILEGIERSFSAKISIRYDLRYPTLINNGSVHHNLQDALHTVFGKENVVEAGAVMASEDFAFYSRKLPSMFYFLGAKAELPETYFLHHPKMQVNEACIPFGVDFLTTGALQLLKKLA